MKRYDVSEESHRRKFRDRSKTKEELYSELATSLLDLANRCLEECSSKEEVIEKLATEQFVTKASEDVRVWIREHKPKTCAVAGQWADEFQLARRNSRAPAQKPGPRRCHKCNQPGHLPYNFPKAARAEAAHPTDTGARRLTPQQQGASWQFRCFSYGETGHIARNCPSSAMFCGAVGSTFGVEAGEGVVRQGKVEGFPVEVLLDTGSAWTVVRKELVPEGKVLEGKTVVVRGVHGGNVRYPLAQLEITVGGRTMVVQAAVSGRLPIQLLLGCDVPELFSLLAISSEFAMVEPGSSSDLAQSHPSAEVVAVTTRAQAHASDADRTVEDSVCDGLGGSLADNIFVGGKQRERLTRSQKRIDRRRHATELKDSIEATRSKWATLDITPEELAEAQRDDPALEKARIIAGGAHDVTGGSGFYRDNSLLYRHWEPKMGAGVTGYFDARIFGSEIS